MSPGPCVNQGMNPMDCAQQQFVPCVHLKITCMLSHSHTFSNNHQIYCKHAARQPSASKQSIEWRQAYQPDDVAYVGVV
jgi:hypothetical protein